MKRNPPIILLACIVPLFAAIAWASFPASPVLGLAALLILAFLVVLFS